MTQFELSAALVAALKERGMKIATVESCTAGLLSKIITDAPGSSEVFDLGITTYSNEMKTKMVGVPEEILAAQGAVSPETARAMAEGIRRVSGADIGVATTGIAGPGGGTPEKPVGLVYTAVSTCKGTEVTRLLIDRPGTDRDTIRNTAAETVLIKVLALLNNM
ncbi:MAG: nicotinamide-nucleotide amidohydrolase family protein [Clostridia bacterium]|nr:nicotinamide-nucleotide amidohydrolase family protein [Clostridia bacterium]